MDLDGISTSPNSFMKYDDFSTHGFDKKMLNSFSESGSHKERLR